MSAQRALTTDSGWDDIDDPERSLGYMTRLVFRSMSKALEARTMPHGVSSAQWRFLRVLWREDGLTQRELSRRVGLREPTIVISLNGLERAGLVQRKQSVEDRRRVHVYLTPAARRLKKKLMPAVAEVNQIATRSLSRQDVERLLHLLAVVNGNLMQDIGDRDVDRDSSI
jgi:DNA-binding MarR family transcriptional regulator